jgi:CRISPR system Cascade subunit CasD
MEQFLVLKLEGVLQAWGDHTFEDFRPSHGFPTMSGVLGLLGACLGIERIDSSSQRDLAESIHIAVRSDNRFSDPSRGANEPQSGPPKQRPQRYSAVRITDFHTVLDARKVGGKRNEHPIVSTREYLCDAAFTVILQQHPNAKFTLDQIAAAVQKPVYTPSLGRRSCPITRPLFDRFVEASTLLEAFQAVEPVGGVIYAESGAAGLPELRLRDRPIPGRSRQFASRRVYIHAGESIEQ